MSREPRNDLAIRVDGLSKRYRIGLEEEKHETLFGALSSWVRAPAENYRRLRELSSFTDEESDDVIWALNDISFEVKRGEVVGVIGHNGAGKSTLLKVLSRITEPTSGYADIYGRVSSLLEVGTGFHPELTGRENVYLNGTVLGMSKAEVDEKYDEIVEFSGVRKFIDTPVKRYSSGMKVRLAFAVAAHLEPEILLIDEVLAVGDLAFQKKCLGKMEDVAGQGRTVLFVSHDMVAIRALCERTLVLHDGDIRFDGATSGALDWYMEAMDANGSGGNALAPADRPGSGALRFTACELVDTGGRKLSTLSSGDDVSFRLRFEGNDPDIPVALLRMGLHFRRPDGALLFSCRTDAQGAVFSSLAREGVVACNVPRFPLVPGRYHVDVWAKLNKDWLDIFERAMELEVMPGDFFGSGRLPRGERNSVLVPHSWTLDAQAIEEETVETHSSRPFASDPAAKGDG